MAKRERITRRDVLEGGGAGLVIVASAGALPGSAATVPDPALEAIAAWRPLNEKWLAAVEQGLEDHDPAAFYRIDQDEWVARFKVGEARAKTLAGLTAQLVFSLRIFGEARPDAEEPSDDPEDYTFDNIPDRLGERLLRNMVASARTMAGEEERKP